MMTLSNSRILMIKALKKLVVPYLREHGFKGSFPHFRRLNEGNIDLVTFQFNRYGGSFVVELAVCGKNGTTMSWGEKVPPNKVTAHDVGNRFRLREDIYGTDDNECWFHYEEAKTDEDFDVVALKVLKCIQDVSDFNWIKKRVSLNVDWE
ncbi:MULTISPECIES: DUF4304 domain-containing protein [unclassified Lysinibacillus]|uniref:DUF4304 domain-containing protein n=1 Tax=unclassified Lysinibacillus TaxID=2636778 RepID=UPI00382CAD02